jgi:hypothetical protein
MGRGGSGNASWKAAAAINGFKKGHSNRRRCSRLVTGTDRQCGQLAMRHVTVCRFHGGKGLQISHRVFRAKKVKRIRCDDVTEG